VRHRRAHINLNAQTKDILDSIRAPGQSYDGIIQELIVLSNKNNQRKQINTGKARSQAKANSLLPDAERD